MSRGIFSFRMAHMFPDCVGEVDVVSDAENIKKLLKIPYSKGPVSFLSSFGSLFNHCFPTACVVWHWILWWLLIFNWKVCGRRQFWPVLRECHGICFEWLADHHSILPFFPFPPNPTCTHPHSLIAWPKPEKRKQPCTLPAQVWMIMCEKFSTKPYLSHCLNWRRENFAPLCVLRA